MKHLLNDLSEEERNNIREQHAGGMKVSNARFNTLLETKSGDVKPLVEGDTQVITESVVMKKTISDVMSQFPNKKGTVTITTDGILLQLEGVNLSIKLV